MVALPIAQQGVGGSEDMALRRRLIQCLLDMTPDQHRVLASVIRGELDERDLFTFSEIQNRIHNVASF